MEDPGLNRRIEETRELFTRWGQFHDFFTLAIKHERVTPEAEMKFLEIKTRIAMLHDGFMASLSHDHKVGQQVMGLLGSCVLLRRVPLMNTMEVQKLELDWNETYMLINETIAGLEEERLRLAEINGPAYKLRKAQELAVQKIHNFFVSRGFILFLFGVAVPGVVIWGLPDPLKETLKKKAAGPIRSLGVDLPYTSLNEIKVNTRDWKEHMDDPNAARALTVDFVKSQLINMGFSARNLNEANQLFDARRDFNKEKRVLTSNRRITMYAVYILFKTNQDADKFLDLRKQGMLSYPQSIQEKLHATVNFARKQNMVGIFTSEDPKLREKYPDEKWGFGVNNMRLAE